ncbi:hypothetical protein ONZ51_g948 [Trametes cubensis]|uniref:Cytochrome b5 heme-binding domain-containing protein n=1 Tax=Trametes cubensis TaxID=1111947 RepID=A0AAD7XFY9_9APHY|nr:hypothetical protein ONZ51_g948 [Trametes cubensis]
MGITVGYHRMYSHRAFRAAWPIRLALALLGASAFQGSIKRFTDDPVHDPYSATRGFLWSHMGWIFFKARYERMKSIDRNDLDRDPIVRLQHSFYVPLALLTGFALPPALGLLWHDPIGAFVYGGLVARLLTWHCTFLVNSLAHWDGLQPYSDDNTSRTNLLLALLTCGEGNHNFHSFPHDFRSGPSTFDWDPSKWVIILLHSLGLATGLRRARDEEIRVAREHMLLKEIAQAHTDGQVVGSDSTTGSEEECEDWQGQVWTVEQLAEYACGKGRCVLLLDGYAVDATEYLAEHPGGASLLRRYAVMSETLKLPGNSPPPNRSGARNADWAFYGGINKHTMAARRQMRRLRVAQVL